MSLIKKPFVRFFFVDILAKANSIYLSFDKFDII